MDTETNGGHTPANNHNGRVGDLGERAVVKRLDAAGWRILARNQRVTGTRGEIDIIALDGSTLVIVEVKTRSAESRSGPEVPLMAVTRRKQAKVRALGLAWIGANRERLPRFRSLRFDAIGIRIAASGQITEWTHLKAAF